MNDDLAEIKSRLNAADPHGIEPCHYDILTEDMPYLVGLVEDLRAVLEDRLTEWKVWDDLNDNGFICQWCDTEVTSVRRWTGRRNARGHRINEDVDTTEHKPGCPVLQADRLLGRATSATE